MRTAGRVGLRHSRRPCYNNYIAFLSRGRTAAATSVLIAEIISSAVVQETVSQVLSSIVQKYEEKEQSNARKNLERLEMAHIRLEAALETSEKWHITDASLLRWHKKLKCAAEEFDDTLHKYKRIILEEEQMEQEVRNSSFLKRIAHATKSFIASSFGNSDNQMSRSIVQRFDWLAHGASEFLRVVEFGDTPPFCRQETAT